MSDLSTGKSILICGIILSCFAVLWPKIFHPMLFGGSFFPGKNDAKDSHRQERRADMHPEYTHPAFRERGKMFYGEEGRQIKRSIDKDMRAGPGPVPGMRPTFGGPGMPTPAPRTQGSMGVLMPMYTIGIIVFFVYTTMKVIFKKNDDPINEPLYSRKTLNNSGVEEIEDSSPATPSTRYGEEYYGNSLYIAKKINANVETLHHEILGNEQHIQQCSSPVSKVHANPGHSISRCTDAACQQLNNAKIITDRTEDLLMGTDKGDIEINLLRQRLEETEKAMERIMAQMGGLVQKTPPTSPKKKADKKEEEGSENKTDTEEIDDEDDDKKEVEEQLEEIEETEKDAKESKKEK